LGSATDEIVLDDPHVVIQGERVLHLRYRLLRVTDPRGDDTPVPKR
jgi:hypothetical protein